MAGRGLVAVAVGAGLLVLGACGWSGRNTDNDDTAVQESFTTVRIANDSGQVKIHTGTEAKVHRTIRYGSDRPGSTFRVENNALVIESCKVRNCSIDYDITVPAATSVDGAISSGSVDLAGVRSVNLSADSGRIALRDIAGKVNLDSSSGSVRVDGASGAVTIRSDSGTVTVTGARGAVSIQADSGSVDATLSTPQDVKIDADSGSVQLTVPREGSYKLTTKTDSGSVRSDVTHDSAGTHRLDLHSDSGSITVRRA
jgi:DUF4097 and DUF4098 domain-containing protein YvlB